MLIQWQTIIPVKVVTPNQYEHWTRRSKRNKLIRQWIWAMWTKDKPKVELPCIIKLCRISPRFLDSHDNLRMALKGVADIAADFVNPGHAPGQADRSDKITFEYDQRKPAPKEEPAIEITIYQDRSQEFPSNEKLKEEKN